MAAHPPEVKARAKAIYADAGPRAAASELGIGVSTVLTWARDEKWPRNLPSAEQILAANEQQQQVGPSIRIGWQVRKRSMADELGQAAAEVLAQLRVRAQAGTVYGIEPMARAIGILTERADAMSAGTGGSEQAGAMAKADLVGRLAGMADELRKRKEAASGG